MLMISTRRMAYVGGVDVGDAVTVGGGVRVAGWVGGRLKVGVSDAGAVKPCNAGISRYQKISVYRLCGL